jgi:uncharacterized protein YdeI (YjbR/CyaY-like superfamily)
VEITRTCKPADRAAWRAWLEANHATAGEVWLLYDDRPEEPAVSYRDAVEEALCFGWIDSTVKRYSPHERAQRFTPRRRRGHWSALNKERARRLLRLGLMTEAGRATLPDLAAPFVVAPDVESALRAAPGAWEHFRAFPDLYRRVRLGYVEEARDRPEEFARRLGNLVRKTAANQMFGNWHDDGRLL